MSFSHAHYQPRKSDGTGNVDLPSAKDLQNLISDRAVRWNQQQQQPPPPPPPPRGQDDWKKPPTNDNNNENADENKLPTTRTTQCITDESPQRTLRPAAVVAAERRQQRLASLAAATAINRNDTTTRVGTSTEITGQRGIRQSDTTSSKPRAQSKQQIAVSASTSSNTNNKSISDDDDDITNKERGLWKSAYDKKRQRTYYYHTVTKEVTWVKPAAAAAHRKAAPYNASADKPKQQNKDNERPSRDDFKGTVDLTSSKRVDPEGSFTSSSAFVSPEPNRKNRRAATYSTPATTIATTTSPHHHQEQIAQSVVSPRNLSGRVEAVLSQVLPGNNDGRKVLLAKYSGKEDELLRALVELRSEMVPGMYDVKDVDEKMTQIKSRRNVGGAAQKGVAFFANRQMQASMPLGGKGVIGSPTPRKRTSPTVKKAAQTIGISRTFTGDSDDNYLEQGAPGNDDKKISYGNPSVRRWRRIMFASIGIFFLFLIGSICAFAKSKSGASPTAGNTTAAQASSNTEQALVGFEYGPIEASKPTTLSGNAAPSSKQDQKTALNNLGSGADDFDARDWSLAQPPSAKPTTKSSTNVPLARPTTHSPTPRPTDPTYSPTPRPTYVDGYEHVVARVDSVKCPPRADSIPMLMSVTNREVVIGCHSFEEYLSPRYETVFILNKDFVDTWEIDKLVRSATCDQTLGATVLLLDNQGGELLGRRLSVDFLEQEEMSGRKIEFLNQMNCDVHPVPKGHLHHMPLEDMMVRMIRDFRLIKAQREPHRYPEVPQAPFSLVNNLVRNNDWMKYEILAMGPLLFEDFPSMMELPLETHGHDVCEWGNSGGLNARPWEFGAWPWLCDVHEFTENHILLFDLEKLMRPAVRHHYLENPRTLGLDGFASDTRTTPRIAAQHELTIVVNRDVYAHQNFGHGPSALNGYEVKDLDLARVHNWVTISTNRSPGPVYDTWNGFNSEIIPEPYIGGTVIDFIRGHFKSNGVWLPENIYHQPLDRCMNCRLTVDSFFRLFGYEVLREDGQNLSYCLTGYYPANIYVMVSDELGYRTPDDSLEFLRIQSSYGIRRYIALGSVKSQDMKEMTPEQRTILVPKAATIIEMNGPSEIKKREYIASRGRFKRDKANRDICGAPDQDRDMACGYLESSEFRYPYPNIN